MIGQGVSVLLGRGAWKGRPEIFTLHLMLCARHHVALLLEAELGRLLAHVANIRLCPYAQHPGRCHHCARAERVVEFGAVPRSLTPTRR